MKKLLLTLLLMVYTVSYAAFYADVVYVIDQSGSMWQETNWIANSIADINTALVAEGVTANYGLVGYERYAGTDNSQNYFQDVTADVNDVIAEIDSKYLYGGTENAYGAVDWAANNMGWSGGDYAKVMMLITDEDPDDKYSYTYGSDTGETAVDSLVTDHDILLNVITFQSLWSYWDDATYTTSSSTGLFDLADLRDDPAQFTLDFKEAKIKEILEYDPVVPEPATIFLLGLSLLGGAFTRLRKKKLLK